MAIRPLNAKLAQKRDSVASAAVEGTLTTAPERPLAKLVRRVMALACLGLVVAPSTGCSITSNACRALKNSECVDDFMIGYRNRAMAEKAWICQRNSFGNRMHQTEFKDGFVSGYLEVAGGGDGCCPTIAPPKYWGWQYQSSNGRAAVNAWFEGYPLGVRAADQDGVGHYRSIQTNYTPRATLDSTLQMGSQGVNNPFYSEEEIIPKAEVIELDAEGQAIEAVAVPEPDSALNAPQTTFPFAAVENEAEWIAQRHVAEGKRSVEASLGDQTGLIDESIAPGDAMIESDFGPRTPESIPTELPFSFE